MTETLHGAFFIWNVCHFRRSPLDWEARKSWSCSSGLWFCSAAIACKVSLWICLALLYKKTPMNTRAVPAALSIVIWLLNTMMLSQTDMACFTVLATLKRSENGPCSLKAFNIVPTTQHCIRSMKWQPKSWNPSVSCIKRSNINSVNVMAPQCKQWETTQRK